MNLHKGNNNRFFHFQPVGERAEKSKKGKLITYLYYL